MRKIIINILKFLVFIGLGIFIFWKVYKGQNINDLLNKLHSINFFWIYVSMFLGILSHVVRALRWVLMAKPLGYKPFLLNSFFAVMIGYFANFAFPRMGEITRCAVIKRYEKIPLSTVLGTVITERVIDSLMLLGITVIAVFLQFDVFNQFVVNNPAISSKVQHIFDSQLVISLFVIGTVVVFSLIIFRKKLKKNKFISKIEDKIKTLKEGVTSVRNVEHKPLFIFYTLLIWALYYLMLYVCFYSFPSMTNIGFKSALTLFVLGSYGMVAPVQGGIGAYHFMIISGLVILGIADADARVFALVVHGSQTIMLIFVGFVSYLILPMYNRYQLKKLD